MTAATLPNPAISKKKKDSKKTKKAWRKVDVTDVENFLENKRLEERLGLDKKKDEELFVIDTKVPEPRKFRTRAEKKEWAKQPCEYLKILTPSSAVEDPIKKRNRLRTPEERRDPLRKKLEEARRLQGYVPKRVLDSIKGRKQHLNRIRAQKRKDKYVFKKDVWRGEGPSATADMWLNEETTKHTKIALGEFKVRPPITLTKPRSQVPAVEQPHPGLSYNPSFVDHKDLLDRVAARELEMARKEEHLRRVTAVPKITRQQKESNWVVEMTEGMVKKEEEVKEEVKEEESDNEVKSVNPPTTRDRMKTKRQRRRRRELNLEASQRRQAKHERKKLNDVYRLRLIKEELAKKEAEEEVEREKRKKQEEEDKKTGVRRLACRKYDEPLEQFTLGAELTGDLRRAPTKTSLLADRYFSLQRRNILAPAIKINKKKKRNVKMFVKKSHRMEGEARAKPKKKQKKPKLFVINKTE